MAFRLLTLILRDGSRPVSVADVLPGALVTVDDDARITPSDVQFDVSVTGDVTVMRQGAHWCEDGVREAVKGVARQQSDQSTLFCVRGAVNTRAAEAVGPMVKVPDRLPRRLLWTMKLRQGMNVTDLVHGTRRTLNDDGLAVNADLIVLVAPVSVSGLRFPPTNSVVVPIETTLRLLKPFGMSVLLSVMMDKLERSTSRSHPAEPPHQRTREDD